MFSLKLGLLKISAPWISVRLRPACSTAGSRTSRATWKPCLEKIISALKKNHCAIRKTGDFE